jgi:hypothetical protein
MLPPAPLVASVQLPVSAGQGPLPLGEGSCRRRVCDHEPGLVSSGRCDGLARGETAWNPARRHDGDLRAPGPEVTHIPIWPLVVRPALGPNKVRAKMSDSRQLTDEWHNKARALSDTDRRMSTAWLAVGIGYPAVRADCPVLCPQRLSHPNAVRMGLPHICGRLGAYRRQEAAGRDPHPGRPARAFLLQALTVTRCRCLGGEGGQAGGFGCGDAEQPQGSLGELAGTRGTAVSRVTLVSSRQPCLGCWAGRVGAGRGS